MKIPKTNALRILDTQNLQYEAFTYDVDENDLTGETVAKKIGAEAEQVFKTLVSVGSSKSIYVFCIPVVAELNLKKCSLVSGEKSIELVKIADLLNLTGYIRGGCSPIGMKKMYPTFVDETAQLFDRIYISAGIRGMQVLVNPDELLRVTNGSYADIIGNVI